MQFILKICFGVITAEPPHDKTKKMKMRPRQTQISLGIRPVLIRVFTVCSVSSSGPKLSSCRQRRLIRLGGCPGWTQTGRMPRLNWVFAGRTRYFVGFVMRRLSWLLCTYSNKTTWTGMEMLKQTRNHTCTRMQGAISSFQLKRPHFCSCKGPLKRKLISEKNQICSKCCTYVAPILFNSWE